MEFCCFLFNYYYLCVNIERACCNHWPGKLPGRCLLSLQRFMLHDCYFSALLYAVRSSHLFQDPAHPEPHRYPRAGSCVETLKHLRWSQVRAFGHSPTAGKSCICSEAGEMTLGSAPLPTLMLVPSSSTRPGAGCFRHLLNLRFSK